MKEHEDHFNAAEKALSSLPKVCPQCLRSLYLSMITESPESIEIVCQWCSYRVRRDIGEFGG